MLWVGYIVYKAKPQERWMISLMAWMIASVQAEEVETWVIAPDDLKYLDLWLEEAHGANNLTEPIDIWVDVDGELISLVDFQNRV